VNWPTVTMPGTVPDPHLDDRDYGELLGNLRDGAWLDSQEFPPLRYAIPAILPEGSTLFVGPPKVGKSLFTLGAGLAVASGGRMLGIPVDERPVLSLALEDGDRRLQDRCRKLLQGEPIPKRFQYLTRIQPGRVIDTIKAWLDHHGGDAPLVMLDTLGKVMPPAHPGESAYQRDYRIGSALKRLTDEYPGSSLLTVHHDRKAESADFVDSVSGTNGLAGAADTIVVLSRQRQEAEGRLQVTGRDVDEGEFALRFSDGAWMLDGHDLAEAAQRARLARQTEALGDRSAAIVAIVNAHPEGVRAAEVADEAGINPKMAADYLSRLERAGRVAKWGRGVYGPSYTPVESVESVESEAA
jgi:RecA-family ATPase